MATIKNKSIKPGSDLNYSEGVKVQAGEDIATGDLIIVLGHTGGMGIAFKADATTTLRAGSGRMLIAKHAIPSGSFGIGLPWQIITFNTAAMTLGDAIYLTAAGAFSNASPFNATVRRQVGTVITVGASGRILIAPESFAPEASDYNNSGGVVKLVQLTDNGVATLNSNVRILDAWLVKNDVVGAGGSIITLANSGNPVEVFSVAGVNPTEVVRANSLDNRLVGAGGQITTIPSGGGDYNSSVYVLLNLF